MADSYSVINSMNKSHSTHHIKICQEKLDNATSQVNKILNENGTISDFQSEVSDTNE
mgnify:CR=1 FL=1